MEPTSLLALLRFRRCFFGTGRKSLHFILLWRSCRLAKIGTDGGMIADSGPRGRASILGEPYLRPEKSLPLTTSRCLLLISSLSSLSDTGVTTIYTLLLVQVFPYCFHAARRRRAPSQRGRKYTVRAFGTPGLQAVDPITLNPGQPFTLALPALVFPVIDTARPPASRKRKSIREASFEMAVWRELLLSVRYASIHLPPQVRVARNFRP